MKAVNPNPIDNAPVYAGQTPSSSRRKVDTAMTGVYIFQYLQSVSPAWALGAEYVYQRQTPEIEEPAMTFVARWAPRTSTPLPAVPALPAGMPSPYMPVNPHDPQQVLTATWQPSSGLIHTSFFRRINQRLELGTEVQMLATKSDFRQEGRREGVASVGFKLDTVFATIRGMVDTQGKVSSVIEEKLAQGLSFQVSFILLLLFSSNISNDYGSFTNHLQHPLIIFRSAVNSITPKVTAAKDASVSVSAWKLKKVRYIVFCVYFVKEIICDISFSIFLFC